MEIKTNALKTLRQNKGWTQQHLADAAGLSLRTIQRVESEGNAAKETVMAICAALEIGREDLSIIPQPDPSQLQTISNWPQRLILILALTLGIGIGAACTYLILGH